MLVLCKTDYFPQASIPRIMFEKYEENRDGKMVQWIRTHAALGEDPSESQDPCQGSEPLVTPARVVLSVSGWHRTCYKYKLNMYTRLASNSQ